MCRAYAFTCGTFTQCAACELNVPVPRMYVSAGLGIYPSAALKTARRSLLAPACGGRKMAAYLCGWVPVYRCIVACVNKYRIPLYDWSVTLRQCDIAASINPPIRVNGKRHSVYGRRELRGSIQIELRGSAEPRSSRKAPEIPVVLPRSGSEPLANLNRTRTGILVQFSGCEVH
jgi:hypothetical protein